MILTFKVKVLKSATLAKYWSLEVDFDMYSETCLLRPLKGLCQVVLIEQVVFISRFNNLTLTSGFFFMIKTFILLSYYKKAMLKINLNTLENY